MGQNYAVTLELPPELYDRVQEIADTNENSIENTLLETLGVLLGVSTKDVDAQLALLKTFTDAQLWAIVSQRLTPREEEKLETLTEQKRERRLSKEGRLELERLIDTIKRQMLLRSEALLQLKNRGYDVTSYFQSE